MKLHTSTEVWHAPALDASRAHSASPTICIDCLASYVLMRPPLVTEQVFTETLRAEPSAAMNSTLLLSYNRNTQVMLTETGALHRAVLCFAFDATPID